MSQKSSKNNERWPQINALVALNAGTRIDCGHGKIAIVPSYDDEVIGVVLEHHPQADSRYDWIDIMVEDTVYQVLRTPSPHPNIEPYFNVREINEDGTGKQF